MQDKVKIQKIAVELKAIIEKYGIEDCVFVYKDNTKFSAALALGDKGKVSEKMLEIFKVNENLIKVFFPPTGRHVSGKAIIDKKNDNIIEPDNN